MYLAYAVPQNGPATPELRRRCAWLHHGLGPHSPTEYKVAGAIFSAPVARLRSDQSVITVEVGRLGMLRVKARAYARPLRGFGLDPSAFPVFVACHHVGGDRRR